MAGAAAATSRRQCLQTVALLVDPLGAVRAAGLTRRDPEDEDGQGAEEEPTDDAGDGREAAVVGGAEPDQGEEEPKEAEGWVDHGETLLL